MLGCVGFSYSFDVNFILVHLGRVDQRKCLILLYQGVTLILKTPFLAVDTVTSGVVVAISECMRSRNKCGTQPS